MSEKLLVILGISIITVGVIYLITFDIENYYTNYTILYISIFSFIFMLYDFFRRKK